MSLDLTLSEDYLSEVTSNLKYKILDKKNQDWEAKSTR